MMLCINRFVSCSKVRYPEDEDRQVLQLKKAVTSAFSLRLHNYVRNKGTSKVYGGWTYRVPDLDHSGAHSARFVLDLIQLRQALHFGNFSIAVSTIRGIFNYKCLLEDEDLFMTHFFIVRISSISIYNLKHMKCPHN